MLTVSIIIASYVPLVWSIVDMRLSIDEKTIYVSEDVEKYWEPIHQTCRSYSGIMVEPKCIEDINAYEPMLRNHKYVSYLGIEEIGVQTEKFVYSSTKSPIIYEYMRYYEPNYTDPDYSGLTPACVVHNIASWVITGCIKSSFVLCQIRVDDENVVRRLDKMLSKNRTAEAIEIFSMFNNRGRTKKFLLILSLSSIPIILLMAIAISYYKRFGRSSNEPKNIGKLQEHSIILKISSPMFIFDNAISDITPISNGAFGAVSKGIYSDGKICITVALKSLLKFDASKLIKEAEIAYLLNHPNILPLIGICFDSASNQMKLVSPFMVNGDLSTYLSNRRGHDSLVNRRIDGELLRSCALQIARGMAYLVSDDQGHPSIIHRDLAARNCMVDHDITIKISDFGLSRHLDSTKEQIKRSMKTSLIPSLSAPESMFRMIFNEKTDVWSFGTLLIELYDHDIDTVPNSVLELSLICHNHDANSRPKFEQIIQSINSLCSMDFEPKYSKNVSKIETSRPKNNIKSPISGYVDLSRIN